MAAAKPKHRELPTKEASQFRQITLVSQKFFELKQYKKSLRSANEILRKFPDHGETLCMKGLLINTMDPDRADEAFALVRKGLSKDLTSHVCWHVWGLVHRAHGKWAETAKAYQRALRIDPGNHQILRDLALVQATLRDYPGLVMSRRKMLVAKPTVWNNWTGFAVAQHQYGDGEGALSALGDFEDSLDATKEDKRPPPSQMTELLLYHNQVVEETHGAEAALEHLAKIESRVTDSLSVAETRLRLYQSLGRTADAEATARVLLEMNPNNLNYHYALLRAKGLYAPLGTAVPADQAAKIIAVYTELREQFPRAMTMQRTPLSWLSGDVFRAHVDRYMQAKLRRGVPSLFSDLKQLYRDPGRSAILDDLTMAHVAELRKTGRFAGAPADTAPEPPSTLFWTLCYAARHCDLLRRTDTALKMAEEAQQHTPTLYDAVTVSARIFKHAGDLQTAAAMMDKARKLDLADRYINNKAALYHLRAGDYETGEKTVRLFTREAGATHNLFQMETTWYEIEAGLCARRNGEFAQALRLLMRIYKHYAPMATELTEVHMYCLRKFTLRAYLHNLEFQKLSTNHRMYITGMVPLLEMLVQLHDKPELARTKEEAALAKLSAAELKKEMRRRKKAAVKAAAAGKPAPEAEGEKTVEYRPIMQLGDDDDLEGRGLIQMPNPLEVATDICRSLERVPQRTARVFAAIYAVMHRRNMPLQQLRALCRGRAINAADPDVFAATVHWLTLPLPTTDSAAVNDVLKQGRDRLLAGAASPAALVQQYVSKHSGSMAHRMGAARGLLHLGDATAAAALLTVIEADATAHTHALCAQVYQVVADNKDALPAGTMDALCEAGRKVYPRSRLFNPSLPPVSVELPFERE